MDRFKFRVFDKEQNKYVESVTLDDEDLNIPYNFYNFMIDSQGRLCANREDCSDDYAGSDSVQYMDSDRFVVEQCTGLKDKNGNLIYEGDIIKCDIDIHRELPVIWNYGAFGVDCPVRDDIVHFYPLGNFTKREWSVCNIEIIGNVHTK